MLICLLYIGSVVVLHIFGKVKGASSASSTGSAQPDMGANDLWTTWRKYMKVGEACSILIKHYINSWLVVSLHFVNCRISQSIESTTRWRGQKESSAGWVILMQHRPQSNNQNISLVCILINSIKFCVYCVNTLFESVISVEIDTYVLSFFLYLSLSN